MVRLLDRFIAFIVFIFLAASCSQSEMTFEEMKHNHPHELAYCKAGKPNFEFTFAQLDELVKKNATSTDQIMMSNCVRSVRKNKKFESFKESLDRAVDIERLEQKTHEQLNLIFAKGIATSKLENIGEVEAKTILDALAVMYCRYPPDLQKTNFETIMELRKLTNERDSIKVVPPLEAHSCFQNIDYNDVMRFWECDRKNCLETLSSMTQ